MNSTEMLPQDLGRLLLPWDVLGCVLGYEQLTRIKACQVSREWREMVISLSARLSPVSELWTRPAENFSSELLIEVISSGDVHLLNRIARSFHFEPECVRINVHAAYKSGDRDVINFVRIRHGFIYILPNDALGAAFDGACECGHIKLVKELMSVNVERTFGKGLLKDGLLTACRFGQFEVYNHLFERRRHYSLDQIMIEACSGGNVDIIRAIYEYAAEYEYSEDSNDWSHDFEYNWEYWTWDTGLIEACRKGHVGAAQLMLKYRSDFFAQCPPWPALVIACRRGHEEIIQLLFSEFKMLSDHIEFMGTNGPDERVYMCRMYVKYAGYTVERCVENARDDGFDDVADALVST